MYSITDSQFEYIRRDLRKRGITREALENELLDHVCSLIERHFEGAEQVELPDFEEVYSATIGSFYRKELRELEVAADLLISCRRHRAFTKNQFFAILLGVSVFLFIGYDQLCHWMVSLSQSHQGLENADAAAARVVYALYPGLVFLILFLTPDRFDPLFPRGSVILVGFRPFIKIIRPQKDDCTDLFQLE